MNKYIILIFFTIFFTNIVYTADTCKKAFSFTKLGAGCSSASNCLNSYCASNNTCTKFLNVGDTCTSDVQCGPSLECDAGTCANVYYATGGDSCSSSLQCFPNMTCSSNICYISTCQKPLDCDFNQDCSSGVCGNSGGIGSACTTRYTCNEGLVCTFADNDATSLTCQTPWGKKENDKCNSSPDPERIPFYIDCDIADGLLCSNEKCIKAPLSSKCKTCKTNSDCTGFGEVCSCDKSGKGYCKAEVFLTKKCKDVFKPLMECSVTNECRMTQSLLFNRGSCVQKNCNYQTCGMGACFDEDAFLNYGLAACSNYTIPGNLFQACASTKVEPDPSSSTILNASLALLMLMLIMNIIM